MLSCDWSFGLVLWQMPRSDEAREQGLTAPIDVDREAAAVRATMGRWFWHTWICIELTERGEADGCHSGCGDTMKHSLQEV